jgi:glucose-6-phosphate dehydrogenase assembly protein OpcA
VVIVAAGERVHHVPPLVQSLLLPDMPVAVWWLGDLPDEHEYIETLLDPADRLIVDSSHFDARAISSWSRASASRRSRRRPI